MPARMSEDGLPDSNPQSVSVPLSSRARTKSHTWGLTYWNSVTVPVIVTTFSGSNIASEWCDSAEPAPSTTNPTMPIAAAANSFIVLVLAVRLLQRAVARSQGAGAPAKGQLRYLPADAIVATRQRCLAPLIKAIRFSRWAEEVSQRRFSDAGRQCHDGIAQSAGIAISGSVRRRQFGQRKYPRSNIVVACTTMRVAACD